MASCTKYIRSDLSGLATGVDFPSGGQWTYLGYSTVEGGPYNDTPANPLLPYSANTALPLGDDFELDTTGVSLGFYAFQYDQGGETYTLTLEVQDGANCAGVNSSKTYASSDATVYDLSTFLDGTGCPSHTVGGSWENMDGASGWSEPNFTPSVAGVGTYRFRYYLQDDDYTAYECGDCNIEAIITVEVLADFDVFITTSSGTCTYTIDLQHPSTTTSGDFDISISADDQSPTVTYDKLVESTCRNNAIINEEILKNHWLYATHITTDSALQNTGYIETLTIQSTTSGNIAIPLAPTTATLTGAGGTINGYDLAFYNVNPAIFEQTIKKAIINYLDSQGYTRYTDYKLSYVSVHPDNTLTIGFGIKNNPSSEWLGIERAVVSASYRVSKGSSPVTTITPGFLASTISITEVYNEGVCPNGNSLKYSTQSVPPASYLNTTTLDYNLIPLTVSTLTPGLASSSDVDIDCSGTTLTANTVNCVGSVTYLWSSGETSSAITKKNGAGTFTVTATCTSPSSSDTASKTI